MARLFTIAVAISFCGGDVMSGEHQYFTSTNIMVEVPFETAESYADSFNEVTLDVIFTDPQGRDRRVPAFWSGGRIWKARYASPLTGMHTYRSVATNDRDTGLHNVNGTIRVTPYNGDNPLFQHGPIRVASSRRHFEHLDGTPFLWLGDTWWMGLTKRLKWPQEFQSLTADRRTKGFNVIQIVAGLYPDMPPFDPRGENEAGVPWTKDYARMNPEYFNEADKRLLYLVDQGIVPCIVGAWGFHLKWMTAEQMKRHWRYLIARYGALPVTWCVAGEANLSWYLDRPPGMPTENKEQAAAWTPIARFVRESDPFHRLVSIHPTALGRLSSRGVVGDENVALLDFDMLQTGHGDRHSLGPTISAVRDSYESRPIMPVLNSEVTYEGIMNACFADVQRLMFWGCILSGAAGHTYGANGIWQLNREDQMFGASPGGHNWGITPWNKAMELPGSKQLGLGAKLLRQYPWHRFEPHPEWAEYLVADGSPVQGVGKNNPYLRPYAVGIDGKVRIIYFPRGAAAIVRRLRPQTPYSAFWFDPVEGHRLEIGPVNSDVDGDWVTPAPRKQDQDWVLVMETAQQ